MNAFLTVAFAIGVLAPLFASAWYAPVRLARLLEVHRARTLRVLYALLFVASLVCMLGTATAASPVLGVLYIAGGFIFMAHIYLCLGLLLFGLLNRFRRVPERAQLWTAIALTIGTTAVGAWSADNLAVDHREIGVRGLNEEFRVMHISDVHLGHHRGREFLAHIVAETNRQRPDLIVITGDLVDGNIALDPNVLQPLSRFEAPTYFVTGNHETYVDFERALELIAAQGVRVLRNERVDTHGIQLVGLDYMNADDDTFDMHPVGDRTIQKELPKISLTDNRPTVLLHHSPVGLDYMAAAGTELMLAGHTHAGQVFPATLLAPLIFRMNQGLYDFADMQVFVSPGAGTIMPRMRLGSTNTIHVLRLVPAPTEDG